MRNQFTYQLTTRFDSVRVPFSKRVRFAALWMACTGMYWLTAATEMPFYRVIAPNGGEQFHIGDTITVRLASHSYANAGCNLNIGRYTFPLEDLHGCCLGRYWLVKSAKQGGAWCIESLPYYGSGEPTQRYYHLPADWIEEHNTMVVFDELGGDVRTIRLCERSKS